MRGLKSKYRRYTERRKKNGIFIFFALLFLFTGIAAWFTHQIAQTKPAENWFVSEYNNTNKVFLPKDDAPHKDKVEWWYYNGHLNSTSGKQYSFHYTIFLINGMMTHTIAHVSLSDHQTGHHFTEQQRSGGNPSINTKNKFQFKLNDWKMLGSDGNDQLLVMTKDFAFDLNLHATSPAVFHGDDGIISLDAAGDSYYYSRERMKIKGTLILNDIQEDVVGLGWFDHQWGNFSIGQLAWDWFSLQLDEGSDIMLYQLRNKSNLPVLTTGSFSQNGTTVTLKENDFILTPGKKWISKNTGLNYPIEWNIKIPSHDIDVNTKSVIKNSEFDAKLTTYNIYWEGAVKVSGSHTGQGFMELSGY